MNEKEKYYYWLDTEFNYGDFSVPKCALIRGERDEDGEKDRNTEEVVAWTTYEDLEIELGEDADENDTEEKIDKWIESEIGFVPNYEVN